MVKDRFHGSRLQNVSERRSLEQCSIAQETGPDRRFRRGSVLLYAEHRKRRDGPVSEASEWRSFSWQLGLRGVREESQVQNQNGRTTAHPERDHALLRLRFVRSITHPAQEPRKKS